MRRNGGVEDPPEVEIHYGKKLYYEIKCIGGCIGERRIPYPFFFLNPFLSFFIDEKTSSIMKENTNC